ncbi:MAG TPA: EamA family transporter [Gaiellaceae bacterium]|jgi:drug/metabolite transporter (DMT)-like permease|nr:EamA family transporter [Gaiellaceae bacterium]
MKLAGALGIVYVVWGSTYLAMAVADRTLPPFLMLSVRFLLAGVLLYLWAARRGETRGAGRRAWGAAAVVGFALLVLDTGGVAWAVQRVPSGTAALLVASVPLFMALIDRTVFGIRLPLAGVAGIATGLVGVAILAGPSGTVDLAGAAVLLFASFAWAAGSAYARVAPLPEGRLASAALQMLTAGAALGVVSVATGEARRIHVSQISGESLLALGYLVVFGSLVAFTVYGWLLHNAATPLLSTYAYVNPAVAVALGWALAGEHVGGREIAAGLVILSSVGMLLGAREPREPAPATPDSLPGYIRAQEARAVELRPVPRLAELHRIAA